MIFEGKAADGLDTPSLANPPAADEIALEDRADHGAFGFQKQVVGIFFLAVRQGDDRQVGGLARLDAAGGGLGAERPGTEKSRHGQQELAGERLIAAVQETNLVEDAQAVGGGQAVGPQADDRAAFEQAR